VLFSLASCFFDIILVVVVVAGVLLLLRPQEVFAFSLLPVIIRLSLSSR
jgi:hypothetical protein